MFHDAHKFSASRKDLGRIAMGGFYAGAASVRRRMQGGRASDNGGRWLARTPDTQQDHARNHQKAPDQLADGKLFVE